MFIGVFYSESNDVLKYFEFLKLNKILYAKMHAFYLKAN